MTLKLKICLLLIASLAISAEAQGASTKVYVGNLSWNTTADTLKAAFEQFGNVQDAIVIRDRDTGRSRGFGFVTFETPEAAEAAIKGLNEQELDGRRIRVNLANARG